MGHINYDNTIKINKMEVVRGILNLSELDTSICKTDKFRKKERVHFRTREHSSSKPLKLVHTDICCATRENSIRGEIYFIILLINIQERLG